METENKNEVTTVKEKKSAAELLKGFAKNMDGMTLTLMLGPVAIKAMKDEVKEKDPEVYYSVKNQVRNLIETLEKSIVEFKETLEAMT